MFGKGKKGADVLQQQNFLANTAGNYRVPICGSTVLISRTSGKKYGHIWDRFVPMPQYVS